MDFERIMFMYLGDNIINHRFTEINAMVQFGLNRVVPFYCFG